MNASTRNALLLATLAPTLTLTLGARTADAKELTGQALVDRYTECWKLFNTKSWDEFGKCYA